jgi:micrococcal nuclease
MYLYRKRMIAVALSLFLANTLQAQETNSTCFSVDEVLKVVDGDTIDVRIKVLPVDLDILADLRIRMEGINAWESRTKDAAEKKLGLAAKKRLAELVEAPISVCLSGKGKYGRWLGTLFNGDTDINQQLIDEGHAHAYGGGKRKVFGQ